MGELINGRTPEEIKHVAEWACFSCGGLECDNCSYLDACTVENRDRAVPDALALIEYLESERDAALEKVPKWISVNERLPENEERVLITERHEGFYGKSWCVVMMAFHTDGKTFAEDSDYNWSEGSVEMQYDEEADDFVVPEGWWEDVQCGDEFSKVEYKVTHWMPLHEPPKEGAHETE